MGARGFLLLVLCGWFLLTIARQICDLVGRLWIPVAIDVLQLIFCITGVFGAAQNRVSLLIALAVSTLISATLNVLLCLWYLGVFGDRGRPLLSAGLPYSFSFFLRNTPGCDSHFDIATSRWVQSPCIVPYYNIEAAIAILNCIIAATTLMLSICLVSDIRKAKKKQPKTPLPSMYSQISRSKLPTAPSSVNDISSGYMNSSYEEVNDVRIDPDPPPLPPELPRPAIPSYTRNSNNCKRKRKPRPSSMPQPGDPYSSTETEEMAREDVYTKPQKPNKGGRFKKNTEPRRATVHEDAAPMEPTTSGILKRSSSGNMASLISFDPKSNTLLRVREHPDDEESPYQRTTYGTREAAVDVGLYEQIRDRVYGSRQSPPQSQATSALAETAPLADLRGKNPSQDSVPSMLAPTLSLDPDGWPSSRIQSPGIRLISEPPAVPGPTSYMSPGIRLTSALAVNPRKSSFQLQPREQQVVGHYHSANEFALTSGDEDTNIPVITGNSLLV